MNLVILPRRPCKALHAKLFLISSSDATNLPQPPQISDGFLIALISPNFDHTSFLVASTFSTPCYRPPNQDTQGCERVMYLLCSWFVDTFRADHELKFHTNVKTNHRETIVMRKKGACHVD